MFLLSSVITGLLAGWLAGKILRGHGFGPPMDMGLGIVGGVSGGLLRESPGFSVNSSLLLASLIAIVCVAVASAFSIFVNSRLSQIKVASR